MSYTKQTWATGDTVTAAKLNHMEDGIEGAGGGGGESYDAIISLTEPTEGASLVPAIEQGTYEDIAALIEDGKSPNILVMGAYTNNHSYRTTASAITYYAPAYTVPSFNFAVEIYDFDDGSFTTLGLGWDAQDNVWI